MRYILGDDNTHITAFETVVGSAIEPQGASADRVDVLKNTTLDIFQLAISKTYRLQYTQAFKFSVLRLQI
jgi:hypothetical protein